MKRTFFYSKTQKKHRESHNMPVLYIHGKEFTEQKGSEGEHLSNQIDAVIVHVEHNIPKDEFISKMLGRAVAETYLPF